MTFRPLAAGRAASTAWRSSVWCKRPIRAISLRARLIPALLVTLGEIERAAIILFGGLRVSTRREIEIADINQAAGREIIHVLGRGGIHRLLSQIRCPFDVAQIPGGRALQ